VGAVEREWWGGGGGDEKPGRKFGIQTDENGQTRVKPNYVY